MVIMSSLKSALGAFVKTSGAVLDSVLTASRSVLARSAKVGSDVAALAAVLPPKVAIVVGSEGAGVSQV
jgi:tRNA G18 (ribose-2'-O)-methylase SpoU